MGNTPRDINAVSSRISDEVSELRKEVAAHRKNMEQSYVRNQDDHKAIMAQIVELVSDKKALRLIGILVGFALGSIVGTVTYFASKLDAVKQGAESHEAEGMEIGRGLRRDVDHNERKIEELQRLHRQSDEE